MSFSSTITITGSTNITNFDIYQCPTSGCTGCVAITGSTGENVSRIKLLTGHTVNVDQGYRYIKLVADTATCNNSICMEVIGIPTYTPTPTPTYTPTPTPTATSTPLPTSTPTSTPIVTNTPTPTPTSTSIPPTYTPTPTPTYTPTPTPTNTTTQNYQFNVCYNPYSSAAASVVYTYAQIINAGFTGEPLYSDTITVSGSPNVEAVYQYYGTTSNSTTIPTITSRNEWDCSGNPITPPTSTPTPTPNFYNVSLILAASPSDDNGYFTVYQSPDNISFTSAVTLTSVGNDYVTQGFNGTPGYYYYLEVTKPGGTVPDLNLYTQVNDTDFSPGPIDGSWCLNNGRSLVSDTFQLPNPTQSRVSIIFYAGIGSGCL
jgi:hypothetical protein